MTRLIWITPEAEQTIAYCARVSNPRNQRNKDYASLIRYCTEHGHWSIFEMASMCVEIKTTRAISPQLLRHRSFSFQEFSQRYAMVNEQIHLPDQRLAGATNRQSSIPIDLDEMTEDQVQAILDADGTIQSAIECYDNLINVGFASESARFVLPLATPTTLYMAGTIRSWIHYIQLRTQPDTQQEHRQIAEGIKQILAEEMPVVAATLI
jgi:thymidylate synthase (FAD)